MMNAKLGSAEVEVELRVRYAETDQMGHAYYSNYLVWFEVGRTTYCRKHGLVYSRLEEEDNIFLPVVEASCNYFKPLRYDESFIVLTRLEELRSRALTFRYEIKSPQDGKLCAEGMTRHIFTNRTGKPKSLPLKYRDLLRG
jgi:acyl-CoA thioester hydrolase